MAPSLQHVVESISFRGGYLDGVTLALSDKINCIIGPPGAGKTTCIEGARYALDAYVPEDRRDAHVAIVRGTLRDGSVTVKVRTQHGQRFTCVRGMDEAPRVYREDGTPADVSLNGDLFKIEVYGQNQIEGIARSPRAQLDLIDKFIDAELRPLRERISDLGRRLTKNGSELLRVEREIAEDEEKAAELPSVKAALEGAVATVSPEDAEARQALEARGRRTRERDAVSHAWEDFGAVESALAAFAADATRRMERSAGELAANHGTHALAEALARGHAAVEEIVAKGQSALGEAARTFDERRAALDVAHDRDDATYASAVARRDEDRGRVAERDRLQKRFVELSRAHDRVTARRSEESALRQERAAMVRDLAAARRERFVLREGVAKSLTERLAPDIQVSISETADPTRYEELLTDVLRGAKIRPASLVAEIARSIPPEDLVALVMRNDPKPIANLDESKTGRVERAQRIVDTLRASERLADIEVVALRDVPRIALKSGSGYKPSDQVSNGQRCTCILPILLLQSSSPLFIDQPEDNVDNAFIYDVLVKSLILAKASRQIVIVTHNPNIPVLGDAERMFVMASGGDRGEVAEVGTVDESRGSIERVLEGGREAFLKRSQRYGHTP